MGTVTGSTMAGMEVPLLNTDSIEWHNVTVPSSSTLTSQNNDHPICKDFSSCCIVGDPCSYFIWRTSKSTPRSLEIIELCCQEQIPRTGLRITFPDPLFPFAFICKDVSMLSSRNKLVLYALTTSGVAYIIRLKDKFEYGTSSNLSFNDYIEYNTQAFPHGGEITAVTATAGYLLIGRNDGSTGCFHLSSNDPTALGPLFELRDDGGFGLFRGILSRCMESNPSCSGFSYIGGEIQKLLFVLHSDGSFRVWNLSSRGKIFSQSRIATTSAGVFSRLWVGDANENGTIPVALLHRHKEAIAETILLYGLHCSSGDRLSFTLGSWSQKIALEEGGTIDAKFASNKVWILKEGALIMREIFRDDVKEASTHHFTLLEAYISKLLFQSSCNSLDDLLWLSLSVLSSAKEEITTFLSTIFMRSLLLPGVFCNSVLRQTLGNFNKRFTDSEFTLLTIDGLKREILSVIDYQGANNSPVSALERWSSFCSQYVDTWCKQNAACGLLLDPFTGAVALIRKNGISICRGLEDAESAIHGYLEEQKPKLEFSALQLDQEILFEVLHCAEYMSQQLGKPASAIFYDSLIALPNISSEEVVSCFLNVLESGYSSSVAPFLVSEMGLDAAWNRDFLNCRNLRKFSVSMHLSLLALSHKARSWSKVLDVIESYLKFLVPRKIMLNSGAREYFYLNAAAVVQATCQISKVMLDCSFDVLMLLSYVTRISGQINMSCNDVLRVTQDLVPMIQEILMEWHIIHFIGTCPSQSPAIGDFDYQLSVMQIGGKFSKKPWIYWNGKFEFSLGYLLLSMQKSNISHSHFPNPNDLISLSREFTSWIIWGQVEEESSVFFSNAIEVTTTLLVHGQLNATEYLLKFLDECLRKERSLESLQAVDCKSYALYHLLGCCLVAQSRNGLTMPAQNKKVEEAIHCFFRTASTEGFFNALQSLPSEAGWLRIDFQSCSSSAACKLLYYQWVMQLFEQYSLSDAAWQFALAALEQVDEAFESVDGRSIENVDNSVTSKKGKLWANVFKFTLDLNKYHDAYSAIISNPDEESKHICLRRFIIVLYDRGVIQMVCDGQLPLIGLDDKVEQELARKAEHSDLSTKPNPFKLLYAFEMHRHNWSRAAAFMYLYCNRLRVEVAEKKCEMKSWSLKERLNGLAVAINALQLVHPAHAWITAPLKEASLDKESYPSKKARIIKHELSPSDDSPLQKSASYLNVEKLEEEFVLTSAEYSLALADVEWSFNGDEKPTVELIDLLVESNLYDMGFTVILKFWKGSHLQSELERVFNALALNCCVSSQAQIFPGRNHKMSPLLLTASEDELTHNSTDDGTIAQLPGDGPWERLELYLNRYKAFHQGLPLIVARTLLSSDPQIKIPMWLIQHFMVSNKSSLGMTGNQSDPAALFRLYVEYGRFSEAVKLLVEYLEGLSSVQAHDVIRRKKPFSVWFPYTYVERLWNMLEQSIKLGHRTDECENLKKSMLKTLQNHLNLVELDSEDVKQAVR